MRKFDFGTVEISVDAGQCAVSPTHRDAVAARMRYQQLHTADATRLAQMQAQVERPFIEELRTAIEPLHARAQQNEFFHSLATGKFDTGLWQMHLQNLHAVYCICDEKKGRLQDASLRATFLDIGLAEAISKDVEAWASREFVASPQAMELGTFIIGIGINNPEAFLGAGYVLYGTNFIQAHGIRKALEERFSKAHPSSSFTGVAIFEEFAKPGLYAQWQAAFNNLPQLRGRRAEEFKQNVKDGAVQTMEKVLAMADKLMAFKAKTA